MRPVRRIQSRTTVLRDENIDTDRIIPARFLTTTSREGLGKYCFNDWRYLPDGSDNPAFPLNRPEAKGCTVLIAGRNFACGSSREHAPWALLDYGIQAVLSSEIADIFRSNALKNGLVAIVIPTAEHRWLLDHPGVEIAVDVGTCRVALPDDRSAGFELEPFARQCLLAGVDQLGHLLKQDAAISRFEARGAAA
ncbi:MAG: 3-isopropylmalate dehydratase small subunit [Rhodanobacteraceae bacterium]